MKSKFNKALFALALASLLAACGVQKEGLINSEKTLKVNLFWDYNFTNNYFCGMNNQPATTFMLEGLYHRLDTVDYITPILADGMPVFFDDNLTCRIKIKDAAKWHNGEDFTARDVWAYYMMQHTTVTNYMLSIDVIDDKTLDIHWNPNKQLTNDIKLKLLALDRNGSIKYDEYAEFVDTAAALLAKCNDADITKTSSAPFGKDIDVSTSLLYSANYDNFKKRVPVFYVATGPFKIDTYTPTQMILTKNEEYWAADKIKFDKIVSYSFVDNNQVYNGLINNRIHYYDGVPEESSLNSMLSQNENLVHLKMLDIDSVGINFNMAKSLWSNPKVRKAMQYIFDREQIKNLANPYGITNYYACNTMPLSEINKHLSQEHIDKMTRYSKNWEIAESLLKEAGWNKHNGKWYNENGAEVEITMASTNSHPVWNAAAIAAQADLSSFGIKCILTIVDGAAIYANGQADHSLYDCVVMFTELNDTLSHPFGSFNAFKNVYSHFTHLPRFNRGDRIGDGYAYAGDINMEFPWVDGGIGPNGRATLNYSEYLNSLYALDSEELENIAASIVCGMSEYMYGVNFFQNVTGSLWNKGLIDGIPFSDKWSKQSNLNYVPDITSEDAIKMAQMNMYWSASTAIINGQLAPHLG